MVPDSESEEFAHRRDDDLSEDGNSELDYEKENECNANHEMPHAANEMDVDGVIHHPPDSSSSLLSSSSSSRSSKSSQCMYVYTIICIIKHFKGWLY